MSQTTTDVLHEQRAEYGEEIVATLSQQLAAEYGRGFDRTNLSRMVKLAGERVARQAADPPSSAQLPAPKTKARRKSPKRKRPECCHDN